MNTKLFKGRNLLLAIKSVLALLFIFLLFRLYNGIQNDYVFVDISNKATIFELLTNRIIFSTYVLPTLILLVTLLGIFKNNKIGWVLITSYFYFLLFNSTFYIRIEELKQPIFFVLLGTFLFLTGIIFLMNLKTIRSDIYKIPKSKQIIHNISATIFGLIFTLAVAIIHNHIPFE